jgi:hypothetical protein
MIKNESRKRDRNFEDECFAKKKKGPSPAYQNSWPVATNNLSCAIQGFIYEKGGDGQRRKHLGTNESPKNVMLHRIVLA